MYYGIIENDQMNTEARENGKNTDNLDIFSGFFLSDFEGWAASVEDGSGYNVYLDWLGEFFVKCPTPRASENFKQVDAILNAAINGYKAGIKFAREQAKEMAE